MWDFICTHLVTDNQITTGRPPCLGSGGDLGHLVIFTNFVVCSVIFLSLTSARPD